MNNLSGIFMHDRAPLCVADHSPYPIASDAVPCRLLLRSANLNRPTVPRCMPT